MPDYRNNSQDVIWEEVLRNYMNRVEDENRELISLGYGRMSYNPTLNGNVPIWYEMDKEDNDEMPVNRDGVACLNCGYNWGTHAGWGCPPFVGRQSQRKVWRKSELSRKDHYLTFDMEGVKKFSRVNQKRLQKLVREQMLSKESLLK